MNRALLSLAQTPPSGLSTPPAQMDREKHQYPDTQLGTEGISIESHSSHPATMSLHSCQTMGEWTGTVGCVCGGQKMLQEEWEGVSSCMR